MSKPLSRSAWIEARPTNPVARWTAAALLSLQISSAAALAIAAAGSYLVEEAHARMERLPLGKDYFGLDQFGGAAAIVLGGGFAVVLPFALWGSCRLVRTLDAASRPGR